MKRVGLSIQPSQPGIVLGASSNDLHLDATGNLVLAYDAEAVGQHARQRLQFFLGEWFLDPTIGVDWFGRVLGYSDAQLPIAEAIVKRTILETPGVTGIVEIQTEFDRANRGAKVPRCLVETEYDDTVNV